MEMDYRVITLKGRSMGKFNPKYKKLLDQGSRPDATQFCRAEYNSSRNKSGHKFPSSYLRI